MIYQIKFKDVSSIEAIDIMASIGTFCIINQTFFVQTNIDNLYELHKDKIENCNKITSLNYQLIKNEVARNWCKHKLAEEEMKEFENSPECQARLEAIMGYLDLIENSKKEGEAIGTKESNHKARTRRSNTGNAKENNKGSGESMD